MQATHQAEDDTEAQQPQPQQTMMIETGGHAGGERSHSPGFSPGKKQRQGGIDFNLLQINEDDDDYAGGAESDNNRVVDPEKDQKIERFIEEDQKQLELKTKANLSGIILGGN